MSRRGCSWESHSVVEMTTGKPRQAASSMLRMMVPLLLTLPVLQPPLRTCVTPSQPPLVRLETQGQLLELLLMPFSAALLVPSPVVGVLETVLKAPADPFRWALKGSDDVQICSHGLALWQLSALCNVYLSCHTYSHCCFRVSIPRSLLAVNILELVRVVDITGCVVPL